jgi:hypothetical protein
MNEKQTTDVSVIDRQTGELKASSQAAAAQTEIQSAIIISRRFPRNEDDAFQKLMKACKRHSFAEDVQYKYPRGGVTVLGPSVNLAREAARVWGNIRYGVEVISDTDEDRQINGFAWDLETNAKVTAEDAFKKLVYRKKDGWIKPDERDLRELTNRRGATLVRNCILQLMPKDLIEDAVAQANETLKAKAQSDPEETKKKILVAFQGFGITATELEKYLKHPIAQCTPQELVDLRGVYQSIKDGNSKWKDYVDPEEQTVENGKINVDDLKKADGENAGHDATGMENGTLFEGK